jgi:acyl carrier protein
MRDTVVRLIAIELGVSPAEVEGARSLRSDLGMDSIAAASLLFALEEEWRVELGELGEIDTIDQIEAALHEAMGSKE